MSAAEANNPAEAWRGHADELAEWTWRNLVNRIDVWGCYLRVRDGKKSRSLTAPRKKARGKLVLAQAVLAVHFRGIAELCGLHSTSPENTCRWVVLDIDKHKEDDGADPIENERAAKALYAELATLGIRCLLMDSNGKGGFHLWIVFIDPVPAVDAYAFGQSLARDLREKHGLKQEIEVFPKQARIERYGNYVRLPGLHHTHEYWTRVWNGSEWLDGEAAVTALLAYEPNPPDIVPKAKEPAPELEEAPAQRRPFTNRRPRNLGREREIALQCLEHLPNDAEPYATWFRVMAATHYAGLSVEDFIRWSARSSKHDEAKCRADWGYLDARRGKVATIGTLIKLARDSGFDPVPRKDSRQNADHGDSAAVERALDDVRLRIDSTIESARDSEDVQLAFDAASDLAVLPPGEREAAINEFEEIFGRKLKLRHLRREIEQHTPKKALRKIQTKKPKIDLGKPWLQVIHDTALALARLNDPPTRFIWSNAMARVAEDEKGRKLVVPLNETFLRGDMGRAITYYAFVEKRGEIDMPPPLDAARDLLPRFNETVDTLGGPLLPPLHGLVETPVLRVDGTILNREGYDPVSGLYYWPAPGLVVPTLPENPTAREVSDAKMLIAEAVGDFPFENDVDRTNACAMLLTIVLRSMVGLAPIAIIDAPQAGTGKSLLARLAFAIANGRDGVMTSVPPTDEEMRKLITSLLMEGASIILLDNLDGVLFHSALAKAITAPMWSDRQLGSNKTIAVAQNATWICTGNNVALGGDLPRRCYRIRLDAKSSRPWDDGRTFHHPDLITWALANRGRLIAALLTVCRAWFADGCPKYNVPRLGTFETWAQGIGSILAHIGFVGFLGNRDEVYESSDEETPQWERFLTVWHTKYGERKVSISTIESDIPADPVLRDALPDALGGFVERHQTALEAVFRIPHAGKFKIRLGMALKQRVGRRFGPQNLFLVRGEDSHAKVAVWAVKVAGSGGSCGSRSVPTRCENQFGVQAHVDTCARAHDAHTKNILDGAHLAETLPPTSAPPATFDPEADLRVREEASA